MSKARVSDRRPLFVVAILVGSFLLFLIQPMVARLALPRLGGAPNVWNSAMLVYQALLLGGYAYAHFIGRWPLRRQFAVHGGLLALAALTLPIALADVPSLGAGREVLWVPLLLLASVGPVFFLVSAQAPLIQRWYASDPEAGDPYPLYAASNLGSFTGLISYPLLIEPLLPLGQQSWLWSAGYGLLILLVFLVAKARWAERMPIPDQHQAPAGPPIGWRRIALWLALSAVPSGLMLSTTTHLTTDIFAMPLLWVIPLGLYLLSFTIAFAEKRGIAASFTRPAPIVLLFAGALAMTPNASGGLSLVFASLLMLFVVAIALHSRLYEDRPEPARLTLFYLVMSAGGALGGLFTALIAPAVFDWVWEHPLLVLAAAALLPLGEMPDWQRRIAEHPKHRMVALVLALLAAILLASLLYLEVLADRTLTATTLLIALVALAMLLKFNRVAFVLILLATMVGRGGLSHFADYRVGERTRSYFGVYAVSDREAEGMRVLTHGTTIHGRQFLDPEQRLEPTAYYGRPSGVGLLLSNAGKIFGNDVSVGIVGLGAGTLACYREPGQSYRFYEIDPAILAYSTRGDFTFMRECAPDSETVIGDARIELEQGEPRQFDVLVVDAFSSDAIPLHLLTREAMESYARVMEEEGVLAIHISNRFVSLEPVLAAFARDAGWQSAIRIDDGSGEPGLTATAWVLLAPQVEKFDAVLDASGDAAWRPLENPADEVWTDDYASAIPHLRWENLLGANE